MNHEQFIVARTAAYVKLKLSGEGSGHDWLHIQRVWGLARRIGAEEHASLYVVELGALLHDIADWKFADGDEYAGGRTAREWLSSLTVEPTIIDHVCSIVDGVSFKGAGTTESELSLEGKVVQDADRLDAIGAIGIARTFAYGGHKGRALYNPLILPALHQDFAAYKASVSPTINHFYEKLLLLKDRMNTNAGRALALRRHEFMESYLQEFFSELRSER